ncbi:hypothetical protein [Enterovibrio nigricans]|uniref:Uncharacterized protein n=1 Tax=Enterovibrio nigricans DSM 22720 TaxID=1121868 RepID=A0A1T4VLM4_9GAMM|nr:hypothetical protein [Enterovibrio nigricans]PKF49477.1 hypothetical protein AT251_18465 [Enterovibrio nigricans]SKA65860.1 hypothetical protein SAMN02745132_04012 [Enterovibrio nigricans DSM 22720]
MRQLLIGVMTLILGFFTLVFATVLGLFVSLCALIAKPFVMKKVRKMQEQQAGIYQQQFTQEQQTPFGEKHQHQGQTIDGDYQDISDRR